jgi:autotransporter-associated beta strand protein
MGGSWAGLGSTNCNDGKCRDPFSEACCETKQSGAAGLTFTQPRKKRSPAFYDTLRVTVTGTTDSPILIHGMPFGVVGKRCPFTVTFMLCWDKFNIEPVPCGSNFANLDVTVCWLQEDTQTETLNFSACDGLTVWLGYAPYNCTTTLVYAGDQKTTSAAIQMLGDGVIEANGGALVLTTPIAQLSSGDRKLTLSGTSVEPNTLAAGVPNPSEGTLAVDKVGVGLWRLAGLSSFSGQFRVISGTIVIANDVGESGASPVGTGTPIVGGDTIGEPAALLFVESGWLVERAVTVTGSSQPVVLGGLGGGLSQFSGDITLNRSVTLQASTDGTVRFTGPWVNNGGSTVVTVGSSGNAGTVQLDSFLPSTLAGLSVVNGTARLTTSNNRINPATPVTVGSSLGSATLDIDSVSQTLSNLTFAGNSASVTGGTLRLANSPSVAVTGTGHSISSVVELDNDATINVSGSLTVSGFVSGQGELKKDGTGTLTLSGPLSHTGGTEIAAGSIVTQTLVSGPPQFSSATFTPDSLTVEFSSAPLSGEQYKLLPSATLNAYNTVTLVNAGSATATYNSATSILTID